MKNKKFKLFASLTSLVMVVAVMAVGVWAAASTTVGITGSLTFSASDVVRAQIAVTNLEYGNSASEDVTISDKTATLDAGKTSGSIELAPISVGAATDAGQDVTVTYTITVKNNATATDAYDELTVVITSTEGKDLTAVITETTATNGTLSAGATGTWTATITLDPNVAYNASTFGFSVQLTTK